jgi:para-aminobenzoate N-oxygenase AurF
VRTSEAPAGRRTDDTSVTDPEQASGHESNGRGPAPGQERGGSGAADRERIAERLLRSTAARSYDPELDINWSAPPEPGKLFLSEHRCTLYGTPLYERLTPQQRRELGKHQAASVAGAGIWLEFMLLRLLAKLAYQGDPASRHVQYALAEMAEECRHSTMFARLIEWMGTPSYRPPRMVRRLGKMLPTIAYGPAMWGAILIGEELTDRYQREMVNNECIQPLVRMVNRIHILEEARHIGFARAELTRTAARLSRAELPYHQALLGRTAYIVARNLISPETYRSVGLDPHYAHRVALANPAHQETIRYGGEKIVAFLSEAGLVGGPGMPWWRRSYLLPS